jgi:uncharacterized protein
VIVVDVNLLLYATLTGFPQHPRAREWWEDELNAAEDVGLSSPAIFGFLRIATNPRVLTSPMPVEAAIGYVREWIGRPNVRFLVPGPRHIDIAFDLLQGIGTAANLTTGVQLAAFALENDAAVFSSDSEFGRFPGLRWTNPLN